MPSLDRRLTYRVVAWRPHDRTIDSVVPPRQGMGRFDNPKLYRILYAAESPEAAVGEALARFDRWEPHLAKRMLVTVSMPNSDLLNFDDPSELQTHAVKPSRVVWPERETTQLIARGLHEQRRWIGLRWWSHLYSPWALVGLWSLNRARVVGDPEPLSFEHAAVISAARILHREG